MTLNTIKYNLPEALQKAVDSEIEQWNTGDKVSRLWAKDAGLWTGGDEAKWLGWLTIVDEELANAQKYRDLRNDIENAEFTDILLMGMGGSSLCPEVLAMTFKKKNFHILDSTVPAQIKTVENKIDLEKTLFIVASKSGSTLEPNCFKQYFFDLLAEKVGREKAGKQFIAITDPGSKLEQVAKDDGFRDIFYGKPEIGGRFSALSAFGMTAAAAMGLDVEKFLKNALEMAEACRSNDARQNPAALLGVILGVCQKYGRDKLTIGTWFETHPFGYWLEQLVAESTGKNDVSIIPVHGEQQYEASEYGNDRVFVFVNLKGVQHHLNIYEVLSAAGHPAVTIELETIDDLAQEFFRWEFATAVAGSVMEINPFNQPDVEAAKTESRKITDEYEQSGKLPNENPFFSADGISLFTSDDYAAVLTDGAGEDSVGAILTSHFKQISEGDYFAVLAYVEMNSVNRNRLHSIIEKVVHRRRVAGCLNFGPRFLHSTGQAYKGGANNGVFLQITSDDEFDLDIPGQEYTFGVVKAAQARGDFQVLLDRDRRALRLHLGADVESGLEKLSSLL